MAQIRYSKQRETIYDVLKDNPIHPSVDERIIKKLISDVERKSLKGTKTTNNLMYAFVGESQARNRYTYWASIAKKEG